MHTTTLRPAGTIEIAPGPPGNLLLRSLFGSQRDGVLGSWLDMWHEYGDVARMKVGPLVIQQIVRPEHIRYALVQNADNYPKGLSHEKLRMALGNGLLTSGGEFWTQQRALMQPMYTPRAVASYAGIMVDSAEQMMARWQTQALEDRPLVVNNEMMRVAMSVISRSMFDIDISESFAEAGQALLTILEFAAQRSLSFIDPPLFIPTPMNRRFKWAVQTMDTFLYGIIETRRSQPLGDDLLSLLMSTRDAQSGQVMSDRQLRDEILITFFAGHETTAQLLTWSWYLLSKHPHVEEKLHEEIERVLSGRPPGLDDVPNLAYTRMILDETLRLYSPVALMARDPLADDEIGGFEIPAGSLLTITPFITHRHPEYWDNPEAFVPERFEPDKVRDRPRYAYYPFGAGSRVCIGQHFALLEATLILAGVAQRYRLRLLPGTWVEPKFMGTLRPSRDVLMTLEER